MKKIAKIARLLYLVSLPMHEHSASKFLDPTMVDGGRMASRAVGTEPLHSLVIVW